MSERMTERLGGGTQVTECSAEVTTWVPHMQHPHPSGTQHPARRLGSQQVLSPRWPQSPHLNTGDTGAPTSQGCSEASVKYHMSTALLMAGPQDGVRPPATELLTGPLKSQPWTHSPCSQQHRAQQPGGGQVDKQNAIPPTQWDTVWRGKRRGPRPLPPRGGIWRTQ